MLDNISGPDTGSRQTLDTILAGLETVEALDQSGIQALRRELRTLSRPDHHPITSEEQLKAESIIAFNFRPSVDACLELWFGKSAYTDTDIRQRFGEDVRLASEGAYDHWALDPDHPRMLLALIILLDQFRRNIFRDTVQMYAADARCLALIKRAIRQGVIDKMRLIERVFPCLVLTHSESLADQSLCMAEWDKVEAELSPTDPLRVFHEVFERHYDVIAQFGRFPHRNDLLGRVSTEDERSFLENADFRFDLPLVKGSDGSFCFQGEIAGCPVEIIDGDETGLAYSGPDMALAQVEQEIRLHGHANVAKITLRKFIVERDIPAIGSKEYLALKADIDHANRAMKPLWPRAAWVESFICNDKAYCVYLADNAETLLTHALLADMPFSAINEVQRIVDPDDFDRDVAL